MAGVAPEERDGLRAGDGAVRHKGLLGDARRDAKRDRPTHRFIIICILRHILERNAAVLGDRRSAVRAPQERDHLRAGAGRAGREGRRRRSVRNVMQQRPLDAVGIPRVRRNVLERADAPLEPPEQQLQRKPVACIIKVPDRKHGLRVQRVEPRLILLYRARFSTGRGALGAGKAAL